MASSLSTVVNNLAEGLHKIIFLKIKIKIKDAKHVELNTKITTAFLNTQILKVV